MSVWYKRIRRFTKGNFQSYAPQKTKMIIGKHTHTHTHRFEIGDIHLQTVAVFLGFSIVPVSFFWGFQAVFLGGFRAGICTHQSPDV